MEKITADPRYRKQVLIKGAVYLALALVMILWIIPRASGHLMQTDPAKAFLLLEALIFLILMLMILGWVRVLYVGIQCVRQKRYPPENTPVLRDMSVTTGKKAAVKGNLVIGSALIAIVMCVYLSLTLARVVITLFP